MCSPPPASNRYNLAAPPKTKSSVDVSHNIKALAVSPKNFTSCPVSSTPTVSVPVTCNAEPSNVKFASPFIPLEPVAVVIRLLPSFPIVNEADQDNTPDPFVVNAVPELPSAVGNTYATEAVLLPALNPV